MRIVPFQDLGKFDAYVRKEDVSEYRFSEFGFGCVINLNAWKLVRRFDWNLSVAQINILVIWN